MLRKGVGLIFLIVGTVTLVVPLVPSSFMIATGVAILTSDQSVGVTIRQQARKWASAVKYIATGKKEQKK
ncbi:MAG TPA: hypothetical protein VFG11_08795 [Acidobacteriota bacterium]|nr:hypothetical protein [Acidobacteriota bacterium]